LLTGEQRSNCTIDFLLIAAALKLSTNATAGQRDAFHTAIQEI